MKKQLGVIAFVTFTFLLQAQTSKIDSLKQSFLYGFYFTSIPDSLSYSKDSVKIYFNQKEIGNLEPELDLTDKEYMEYLIEFKRVQIVKKEYEERMKKYYGH